MPPDVEALTLAWLRARPTLAGYRFGTRRPADLSRRLPYVLVQRTGGAARLPTWRPGPLVDRAGINLQAWAAPDPAAARAVMHAVLAELYAARGATMPGGTLVRVTPLAGPAALPDGQPPDTVHRVTASVQMAVH